MTNKKFLFLKEALLHLDSQLQKLWGKLNLYHGKPEEIIPKLCEEYDIEALYANKSYSRYGTSRDEQVEQFCLEKGLHFECFSDYLLVEPHDVEARKVFTPFYKLWQKKLWDIVLASPESFHQISNDFDAKSFLDEHIPWESHPYFTLDFWKQRLENFAFPVYNDYRNDLDKDGTSRLSPYLRFGIFSIREVYQKAKQYSESYVSELAWREFWQHIAHYFPYTKSIEFQEKRRHIARRKDEYLFEKWCKGETGYPVVDAAMKQLVETNWMHGRARMIVASFLTKDLLIDWRLWEEFFKKHLLDYDENVNFWNWQWSASVWADPKPLRIFSPILQSQKFDPHAQFIKKYIPALNDVSIESIHDPLKYTLDYCSILVDHREAQKQAREVYKGENI